MSCKNPMGATSKIVRRLVLCASCAPIAEHAILDVKRSIAQSLEHALNLLDQRIMAGGLLGKPTVEPAEFVLPSGGEDRG